jgi:succinoglycan biosynthesis protein ExoH
VTRLAVDQNLSTRINLMRILLICGIVFVHVPYATETSPYIGRFGAFDWMRVFLGDSLFRIGVPCLSAISGYLLFRRGLGDFRFADVLQSKAKTVLVPFLLWNLGLLLLVLLLQRQGTAIGYFPDLWNGSTAEMADYAFALQGYPINLPLYFLRDLLVCILLSPLLAALVSRAPALICTGLFVLAILPDVTIGIVLKKSILFSFAFGIALALHRIDTKVLDKHASLGVVATMLAAVLLATALYTMGPAAPFWLDLARNSLSIVGALGFWLLSAHLVQTSLGQRLAQSGSLSFWIFCGHYPLLVCLWMVWNRVAPDDGYPLFYTGAIVVTFVILILSNAIISRLSPATYQSLTGSRGRSGRAAGSSGQTTATGPHRKSATLPVQNGDKR